ncbi:MAG: hypothetical protein WKG07_08070 [Hymenobacter sp.]
MAELWLSTDADPTHKVRLATGGPGWTTGPRNYLGPGAQQAVPVTLRADRVYYVEVLLKQEWGPGYASVSWQRPDGTPFGQPIAGAYLSPYDPALAPAGPRHGAAAGGGAAQRRAAVPVSLPLRRAGPANRQAGAGPGRRNAGRVRPARPPRAEPGRAAAPAPGVELEQVRRAGPAADERAHDAPGHGRAGEPASAGHG